MAVTYEWTWGPMKVENVGDFENVVTGIQWICLAKDLSVSDVLEGKESSIMPTPVPDVDHYVPIDQLTNEIVQGWIEQGVDRAAIESQCLSYLEQQLNPPVQDIPVPPGVTALFSSKS